REQEFVHLSAHGGLLRLEVGSVRQRKIEGKYAPFPDYALQLDFASEKVCNFAADREAQAGSPVSSGAGAVGLLERFEDDSMLIRRNADAGVLHRESDDGFSRVQDFVFRVPSS